MARRKRVQLVLPEIEIASGPEVQPVSDTRITTQRYADYVREHWGAADLDPCGVRGQLVPARVKLIWPRADGLKRKWWGADHRNLRVWCNPPWSPGRLRKWITKVIHEVRERGAWPLVLLPGDLSTRWATDIVDEAWRRGGWATIATGRDQFGVLGADGKVTWPGGGGWWPSLLVCFDPTLPRPSWPHLVVGAGIDVRPMVAGAMQMTGRLLRDLHALGHRGEDLRIAAFEVRQAMAVLAERGAA